jgi:hypothetical protein
LAGVSAKDWNGCISLSRPCSQRGEAAFEIGALDGVGGQSERAAIGLGLSLALAEPAQNKW